MRDERNWSVLHRLYPRRALEAREEGLVGFTVRIDSRGDPTQCRITQSSGHPLLDMETCQLIMVHADFKRPSGGSRSQQRWYEGVVNWKLPAATAAAPVASPPIASKAEVDEMICKRFPRTGSNVAIDRVCMRKSEWSRESGTLWQEKGRRN